MYKQQRGAQYPFFDILFTLDCSKSWSSLSIGPKLQDQDRSLQDQHQDQDQFLLVWDRSCHKTEVSDHITGNSDGIGGNTWSTCSKNGNKTAKNNVKNFTGSLTTVVRAQNDTSKTANITFSILHVERYTCPYLRSHAANWRDETVSNVRACAVRVSFVIIHLNTQSFG